MYLPNRFKNENLDEISKLIHRYPLATVISVDQESPFVSHLPLVFEKIDDGHRLIGHLAKGNPHWKLLENREVYAIFHGPNAYITPQWYEKNDVPTWSYAVVHVKGCADLPDLNRSRFCDKIRTKKGPDHVTKEIHT